jgi:archaeal type IV pilus assembly protein PilA
VISLRSNYFSHNDEAVSAVISVILLVAITVIIAAVVAAFTLGMTKSIPDTRMLTGTVSHVDANHVTVTYQGGQDQKSCVGIRWVVSTTASTVLASTIMGSTGASAPMLTVGNTRSFVTSYSGKKHIVATAYFTDDTQQIILDTWVG